jgi:hypothetical protein
VNIVLGCLEAVAAAWCSHGDWRIPRCGSECIRFGSYGEGALGLTHFSEDHEIELFLRESTSVISRDFNLSWAEAVGTTWTATDRAIGTRDHSEIRPRGRSRGEEAIAPFKPEIDHVVTRLIDVLRSRQQNVASRILM